MGLQTYSPASRTARFFSLLLDSAHDSSRGRSAVRSVAQSLRRLVALAMAVLLLPMGQGELFAQQAPYSGQYAPYYPSGNVQPQDYAQQRYTQSYPVQPYGQQSYPTSGQTYSQGSGQVQPLNPLQLQQLLAPIALYPDTLVAQVLAASTYPLQVVDADRWRQAQGNADSYQIAAGADVQPWDPSVKALTAFPQVLAQMDRNLQWTTELGNAYYNQPQDLLQTVQVMRQRAQAAGNLQNTPQEAVSYNQGNIVLAPVNPQMVYVPAYNPWTVYGQPVSPYPGFSLLDALGSFFGSSPVRFGLGIAMSAFTHVGWGWLGWALSWLTQSVLFHQSNYYSQSTTVADWGFPHGGARAFSQQGRFATVANNYYRTPGGYGWSGGGSTRTPAPGFVRTPTVGNRPVETYNRGYQTPATNHGRSTQEAYNGVQPIRPQQFGRTSYGSSLYSGPAENYVSRPGATYGSSMQAYRPPSASYQRGDYALRSSRSVMGKSFAQSSPKPPHSSGFHLFGGGHAPKGYSSGKSFGRRSGGGHSGGHGGGGKHHFL
jgi:hypothetical protein